MALQNLSRKTFAEAHQIVTIRFEEREGTDQKMKKIICTVLFFAVCGCTQSPTISNPTVTQILSLTTSGSGLTATGTFYDVTAGTSTAFSGPVPTYPTTPPASWTFQTGKHDTIYFQVSMGSSCTLYYSIGTTSASASTDSSGDYTSSQFTF
jgi:hypothetical protein